MHGTARKKEKERRKRKTGGLPMSERARDDCNVKEEGGEEEGGGEEAEGERRETSTKEYRRRWSRSMVW